MENKVLEPKAMERLQRKIIYLENQNAKNHKLTDVEMINRIKNMIEEEVDAYKSH